MSTVQVKDDGAATMMKKALQQGLVNVTYAGQTLQARPYAAASSSGGGGGSSVAIIGAVAAVVVVATIIVAVVVVKKRSNKRQIEAPSFHYNPQSAVCAWGREGRRGMGKWVLLTCPYAGRWWSTELQQPDVREQHGRQDRRPE